ncbi:MAG TPA: hypothetical protein VEK07_11900 [Polyangiaceae bacterium]|nr:hypothetical protein [Polyangiaceae bacterium]
MQRPVVRLPIYARETIARDRSRARDHLVFCPPEGRTIDAKDCLACGHARAISDTTVICCPPVSELVRKTTNPEVGAVASAGFTCVVADVCARAVQSILPEAPWGLPVVDVDRRFCGFVSRVSLEESGLPPRLTWTMRVGDLAVGHALAIDERCTLHEAVEMLAVRRARTLAIVDSKASVRGLLTDIEALRAWTALQGAP